MQITLLAFRQFCAECPVPATKQCLSSGTRLSRANLPRSFWTSLYPEADSHPEADSDHSPTPLAVPPLIPRRSGPVPVPPSQLSLPHVMAARHQRRPLCSPRAPRGPLTARCSSAGRRRSRSSPACPGSSAAPPRTSTRRRRPVPPVPASAAPPTRCRKRR